MVGPSAGMSLPQAERQEKARRYARARRYLLLGEMALGLSLLLAFFWSGLSLQLSRSLPLPPPGRAALYFLILALGYEAISAPLTLYGGLLLPRRYGLSTQSLRRWLGDLAKGGTIALALGTGLMVALYWLLAAFPGTWWLWASGLLLLVMVVMTFLGPLVLLLFFKLEPLADPELRERLLHLAKGTGARLRGVFTFNESSKGNTANAALAGLGATRRILLSDTLLQRYSPQEIEVILAHELGHHRHGDVARLIALQGGLLLGGFYLANLVLGWATPRLGLEGLSDLAGFPLLALVLVAFHLALSPLANLYSRHLEQAADGYALALTDNPTAFISMILKLSDQNLAESQPSPWVEILFHDHPPCAKRVAQAQGYAARRAQIPREERQ